MIKNIFWDFDGVILESNKIRSLGFQKVLKDFPESQVQSLIDYHEFNGGLSRYVKFRYFYQNIRKEEVKEEKILDISNDFSKIMRKLLVDKKLLICESLNFIKSNYKDYKMHVISGSDQNELRFLCHELGISKYFISVLGSPTPKTKLVESVLKENKYSNEQTIFIGDSINDYYAAKDNNIFFMGYNNNEIEKKTDFKIY